MLGFWEQLDALPQLKLLYREFTMDASDDNVTVFGFEQSDQPPEYHLVNPTSIIESPSTRTKKVAAGRLMHSSLRSSVCSMITCAGEGKPAENTFHEQWNTKALGFDEGKCAATAIISETLMANLEKIIINTVCLYSI